MLTTRSPTTPVQCNMNGHYFFCNKKRGNCTETLRNPMKTLMTFNLRNKAHCLRNPHGIFVESIIFLAFSQPLFSPLRQDFPANHSLADDLAPSDPEPPVVVNPPVPKKARTYNCNAEIIQKLYGILTCTLQPGATEGSIQGTTCPAYPHQWDGRLRGLRPPQQQHGIPVDSL